MKYRWMEYRDGYHIGCALGMIQRRGDYNVELGCQRKGGLYREGLLYIY